MIDVHSHIIPGIDDGSGDFDTSLEILKGLESQGFTDVILTPHYVADTTYVSTKANNQAILQKLQEISPVNLHLGNEIYIDRNIAALLDTDTISSLAGSSYLLIELPMSGEFEGYEDIFKDLQVKGYKIVLAHPERYHAMHEDFSILAKLRDRGILFQCNYGSFIGQYGKNTLKTAKKLAKNHWIFTLGTDIHRPRDYSEITRSLAKLSKFYAPKELEALTADNPRQILS